MISNIYTPMALFSSGKGYYDTNNTERRKCVLALSFTFWIFFTDKNINFIEHTCAYARWAHMHHFLSGWM